MPRVVPPAQGRRSRPGAVGGVAAKAATSGRESSPRVRGGQEDPATSGGAVSQGNGPFAVGQDVEVMIEDVAQGGWCVARPDGLPVIFVRHALPGERVVARVTEVTSKFARADAVDILQASPDRVDAPCRYAHPGGCGGCDWQHASLPAQRALKASVVTQQLRRLAGIDLQVTVEPLPGDEPEAADPGLGWRTRVQFAVDREGVAGLRGHRSHQVIGIADCLIAHRAVRDLDIPGDEWPGATSVEVAAGGEDTTENFAVTVVEGSEEQKSRARNTRHSGGARGAKSRRTLVEGRNYLAERAGGRLWQVSADGFWQVHPAAADALTEAVRQAVQPQPGDVALDLYCGAGLFAGMLAGAVGPSGTVIGIESDQAAVRDARHNLRATPWARVHRGDVAEALARADWAQARIAVLDPPRAGAGRAVLDQLLAPGTSLGRVGYVSCDPATLARDIGIFQQAGWQLGELRAFDAFPMTHHVECVATLTRG